MLDRPLIINLAPTGAVADKQRNAAVPIVLEDIVSDVAVCARLGASIAHLHVRNPDGSPSCDAALFAQVLERLRQLPECRDMVLCTTTSGRHGQTVEQRTEVLGLPEGIRPDMASLTLGSLNFVTGASINAPDTVRQIVDRMNDVGIKPELEAFDIGMIEFGKVLIREGRLKPPYYFNLLLGNIDGLQATPQHLGFALSTLPDESIVSVAGIGRFQSVANALGAICCDGVRVGLEDNLWSGSSFASGAVRTAATNESSTKFVTDLCAATGRIIATPDWVRTKLNLARQANHVPA
jgi:uncharacterized protein (DUF849 family)